MQFWSGCWYKTENIQSLKLFRTENVQSLLSYKSNVSKKLEVYCLFRQPLSASLHFYLQKLWWPLPSVRMWNCQPPIETKQAPMKRCKPGRPIPSVTTKNSRSGMTACWKTTKDLHKPSKIRKKKRNSLDSSEGKGERVWRSSEWCRRAGQPGSNKMWSLKDAGEKTRWGQKTHCKLKTRASVSKEQFISQRTAASRPTTTAIDPRQ